MDKLHLIFTSTAGDFEDDFQTDRLLSSVKDEVMVKLKLDQRKATEYIVTLDGNPLDESKKLSELKLTDGAVLVIERKEVTRNLMDEATVKAKIAAEIDRVLCSKLPVAFGWTIDINELDAFVTMSPRGKSEQDYLLKVNFDDFPRQAPSFIFVDVQTRSPCLEAWPLGVKHGGQPDGICVAGTRECHSHYHKNEAHTLGMLPSGL